MTTVSELFNLNKKQQELDFVDVNVEGDVTLFIDPFAISQRTNVWCQDCHKTIITFFDHIIDNIMGGDDHAAYNLLQYLQEPNEIRMGYSRNKPRGAGIGVYQSEQLLLALRRSSAVATGFLSSLQECELMVTGIGRDKISDLTVNIIREQLAEYTKQQCELFNIPTQRVPLPPYYRASSNDWVSDYFQLPVASGLPLVLVPKVIVRYDPAYEHRKYYNDYVLKYLKAEHLNAGSSLVKTLKNGKREVYKKDLKAYFPLTKYHLFQFSEKHPEVLEEYREELIRIEKRISSSVGDPKEATMIAKALIKALDSIPPGRNSASDYHNLMIGVVEFLFFPHLLYPKKEQEIHQGRKRIDIVMENGARTGAIYYLHKIKQLYCPYVMFECKNYETEVANPELDQIAGRFSLNRGKFGIICCRKFEDRQKFIERCRDTFKDDRGLIIPLDDVTIIEMLSSIADDKRPEIDNKIRKLIDTVWLS